MSAVLSLVVPFFGLILLGYLFGRIVKRPAAGLEWLNVFILYLALPALFFQLLSQTPFEELSNAGFIAATTAATFLVLAIAFGVAMLRTRGDVETSTIQALVGAYSNNGYLGPGLAITALGSGKTVVIGTVAVLFIPIVARTVRAAVLAERNLDYVTSARLRGENTVFIVGREILPNVMGPIIVETTVRIGYAIFTVAGLAFLGAGPEQGSTDWGAQVSEARPYLNAGTWWPTIFPALAIASLVVAVNLIADAVQSVLEA